MRATLRFPRRRLAASAATGAAAVDARQLGRASLVVALASASVLAIGCWWWWQATSLQDGAAAQPPESEAPPATSSPESSDEPPRDSAPAGETPNVASEERESDVAPFPSERLKERESYARFLQEARDRPGALEELAPVVLAEEGARSRKVALLRALVDSRSPAALEWLEVAVRTLPETDSARGESVPKVALELLARSAALDEPARATLSRLAFDTSDLHVTLRRRSARLYASCCAPDSLEALRRRLVAEEDRTVVSAALAALDERAGEPGVRRWLDDFADWPRPTEDEP